MPFNYVPERAGEAHKWLRYLEDAWGADHDYVEKLMALQEAFAAPLFVIAPRFQRAIPLYGPAAPANSQPSEVLRSLCPPKAPSPTPPATGGGAFHLSVLFVPPLNLCGQT